MKRSFARRMAWAVVVLLPLAGGLQTIDRAWRPLHYHLPADPGHGAIGHGAATHGAPRIAPDRSSGPVPWASRPQAPAPAKPPRVPGDADPVPADDPSPPANDATHVHAAAPPHVHAHAHPHVHRPHLLTHADDASASDGTAQRTAPPHSQGSAPPGTQPPHLHPHGAAGQVAARHHHDGDARDVVHVGDRGDGGDPARLRDPRTLLWTLVTPSTWVGFRQVGPAPVARVLAMRLRDLRTRPERPPRADRLRRS